VIVKQEVAGHLLKKINSQNLACFSSSMPTSFTDHNHHTFHHEFTIKTPPQNRRFSRPPSKNARETGKTGRTDALDIFLKNRD
jgi:hypothetical protein